jgi:hypothetical protein
MNRAEVAQVVSELETVLKLRAKARGLLPGSKPYLSYVCGTRDRERKRMLSALAKLTALSAANAARRD